MTYQPYIIPYTFAATYSCNAYGEGAYNEEGVCTSTSVDDGAGGLIDTGVQVALPISLGVALIIAAVALFVRKPKKGSEK